MLFDGNQFNGESPNDIKQIYADISTAIFGSNIRMSAGYLHDISYKNYTGKYHAGIDIAAFDGTGVHNVVGGTVAWIDRNPTNKDFIAIDGDDGKQWVYGHLKNTGSLTVGQRIEIGDYIGPIGTPSGGAHLHFEVRTTGTPTGGASTNKQFIRDNTMSPLQAFWEWMNT